jgi:hypothetical protein
MFSLSFKIKWKDYVSEKKQLSVVFGSEVPKARRFRSRETAGKKTTMRRD